ncbi:tetratricopeptide repeat protein [Nocardia miyunensis]|uniref:tetratricopeptide repeat protein n=1 Tax=Nocardia miyunensis TaxID=282684 RepID=UPI00082BEB8E|nr:tetratricopeptide repeat protein [Nocardia miyunensis]
MTGSYLFDEQDLSRGSLADRYGGTEPVRWQGQVVQPMYCEALGADPTMLSLTLRRAAPPAGVIGVGIAVSVLSGHVVLDGRRLRGVDVWTEAMSGGVEVELCGAGPDARFTLTPVWMGADGTAVSWTGEYGVLADRSEDGSPVLRCSTGVGAPDFAELVVAVGIRTAPTDESRYSGALYDLGVAMHGRGETDQACALWGQAAGLGHVGAAYDLGAVRFGRAEFDEAERWWRAAAERGDVRAMTGLAEVLDRRGSPGEARRWREYAGQGSRP